MRRGSGGRRLARAAAIGLVSVAAALTLPTVGRLPGTPAPAQARALSWQAETGFTATVTSADVHSLTVGGRVALDGDFDLAGLFGWRDPEAGPAALGWHVAANPSVRVDVSRGSSPRQAGWRVSSRPLDWALEEAYLTAQRGVWAFSAGRERLPLEVARLSLPYSVEPVAPSGVRLGLWGVRVIHWSGSTRLRVAGFEDAGRMRPAVSLRWQGEGVELEGHALGAADDGQVTAGATASGAVGELVAYGEVWHGPEWRFVGGLSGMWGQALWTVEAGRAAPAPGQPVRRLVAAQLAWQDGEGRGWSITPYGFLDPDGVRVQVTVDRVVASGTDEVRWFASVQLGPPSPGWSVGAAYRVYWGAGLP